MSRINSDKTRLAQALKQEARRLGFDACGLSRAEKLDEESYRLEEWLRQGRHASMAWMENHFEKRTDPRLLVDGAKTVVSVLHNYFQEDYDEEPDSNVGRISRYAWGSDYHEILKEKLFLLFEWIRTEVGEVGGRAFVDSAPVMDKAWARKSGLGWIGKSTMLLNRSMGSFFFVGELIIDLELPPDGPIPDYCGSCTRCIDACPTDALAPYQIDAGRCISYLTIENREAELPEARTSGIGNWIFGCDICQDVCPWNKFSRPTTEPRFLPRAGVTDTELQEWVELDLESFRERFRKSPVKRAKYEGFQRNVRVALKNYLKQSAQI